MNIAKVQQMVDEARVVLARRKAFKDWTIACGADGNVTLQPISSYDTMSFNGESIESTNEMVKMAIWTVGLYWRT